MTLPEWEMRLVVTEPVKHWKYRHGYCLICPRCDGKLVVPISWPEGRQYQSAPCPHCFRTNAVPDDV